MRLIVYCLLALSMDFAAIGARADDVVNRPTLTLHGAKSIAAGALHYAHEHGAPGAAIAVVDAGGVLLYVERIDGTFQNAANISIGKARTAVAFGKPTRVFEDIVNKGRYTMLALPEIASFTPLMGGVPIEIGGELHAIAHGNVVVIPHGIPHWFRRVSTPFTYYVVKSSAR